MGLYIGLKPATGYFKSGASWDGHQCGMRPAATCARLVVPCGSHFVIFSLLLLVAALHALGEVVLQAKTSAIHAGLGTIWLELYCKRPPTISARSGAAVGSYMASRDWLSLLPGFRPLCGSYSVRCVSWR